jgi:hypothetical protein
MPAQVAANAQDRFALIREQLGQYQRQNHAFGGMAARVAKALFQLRNAGMLPTAIGRLP